MARRGRRQVLQLDDVSSSHSPRPRGFAPAPREERKRAMTASNPLLSLVGYSSDASTDDDSDNDDNRADSNTPPTSSANENRTGSGHADPLLEIPLPSEAEPVRSPERQDGGEPNNKAAEPEPKAEPKPERQIVGSMLDIPLPESSGPPPPRSQGKGSGIEMELASFFAEIKEIESTTADTAPPDTEEGGDPTNSDHHMNGDPSTTADSSQSVEVDHGFIPKADASVPHAVEESSKLAPASEEKPKSSTVSNAYQSMFVKGASEFVRVEKEDEKKNGAEVEEELPEEPVSEWQLVQDDTTGYYYYWNTATNEVTWEIPPGYTQFLLLLKEYQERMAAIPKDRLQRIKDSKRHGDSSERESSPAPSTSRSKKEKKHKRDKHRKENSEPSSSSLSGAQIGPQLPPMPPEDRGSEVKVTAHQSDPDTGDEVRNCMSPKPSSEERVKRKPNDSLDSAVDSTSVSLPQDVEAIFDEALSAVSESHADSSKADAAVDMFENQAVVTKKTTVPVVASSSGVENPLLPPSMDVTTSVASVDSSKSASAESSKAESPASGEGDSVTTAAISATNTSIVSSSSVVLSAVLPNKSSKADSGDGVVTNSGVSETGGLEEDDDDDLDMDFDDIDDVDRALEKALEKKLEKKKAELEKLESRCEEDMVTSDGHLAGPSGPTHSRHTDTPEQNNGSASAEAESAVSSSVKTTGVLSPTTASTSSRSSSSAAGDRDVVDSSEARSESARFKRLAAESSVDGSKRQEPAAKKARLVAYDAAETDEESVDASEELSAAQSVKVSDVDNLAEVLPTPPPEPVDNLAEIEEMVNTATAKLGFLDVTVEGLTPLQTSLIALQTRMTDWQNGGLNGEYFYQRLKEVNDLLTHYESRAVPTGWSCQWDRRYFYIRESTGQTQWEYPDTTEDAPKAEERKSKKGKSSKKKRSKVTRPEPMPAQSSRRAPGEDSEAAVARPEDPTTRQDSTTMRQDGTAAHHDGADEDLDGVAMNKKEMDSHEWLQGEKRDNQPSTSTEDPGHSEVGGAPSSLQSLFPGEPLPPGTELLLGLPPPPPPPLPDDETATTTTTATTTAATAIEDAYVCADDSSDEGSEKGEDRERREASEERGEMPNLDPDIDGEEMVDDDEEGETKEVREEEECLPSIVVEDPAVISRPPQLRFPPPAAASSAVAYVSSSSSVGHATGTESSSAVSSQSVLSAAPVLNTASGQPLPDSASSSGVTSPKTEERHRSPRSPAPSHEPSSSSGGDHNKRDKPEKHKKKKKEKLGSHTMSLKKKGVSTMVQTWQKVQKEVEKEERANQQRQLAIRQQLDEWKKGNS